MKNKLGPAEKSELFAILKTRFEQNSVRHRDIKWPDVQARLEAATERLRPLAEMERTGGEPDVIGRDKKTGQFIFADCSAESPKGRRSVCYDEAALEARKEHKPADSAAGMAADMGVEILTEDEYRELQTLGEFDLKSSSWILTPADVRSRGGALFCDRRYGRVFTYHNGAESYYAARGFRAKIRV